FAALSRARSGDRVLIDLAGGSTLTFVVDSVGLYPQSAFPTDRVYGGSKQRAEIRLITCGGRYDRARGGYQSNVVVFGHLVRARLTPNPL
ncbi:MAG TPA: sortase, partial [Sporichthya sp.]|nr:sortase [Sporichthya sp.]